MLGLADFLCYNKYMNNALQTELPSAADSKVELELYTVNDGEMYAAYRCPTEERARSLDTKPARVACLVEGYTTLLVASAVKYCREHQLVGRPCNYFPAWMIADAAWRMAGEFLVELAVTERA